MITLNHKSEYEGFFKLRVWDRYGKIRKETDWFPNLIVDMGLDSLGLNTTRISTPGFYKGNSCVTKCWIGSGNTPPAVGDTSMTSVLNPTSGVGLFGGDGVRAVQTAVNPWYASRTGTYRFGPVGFSRTVAELGVFFRTSGSPPSGLSPNTDYMFNHALVVDGFGVPTTITVLGDETLDVLYELRVYPLQADVNYNVTISGVLHSCTMRASNLSTNAQANNVGDGIGGESFNSGGTGGPYALSGTVALGPITGSPTGTPQYPGPAGSDEQILAYTLGSFQRTIITTWNLTNGSSTFFAFHFPSGTGNTQVLFSPGILKTSAKILTINNRYQWARRVLP